MIVYIDIILLENLCMNYIILFATAYIMKLKISHIRLVASSGIGAIYSIMLYMQILPIYSNLIMKIVLSIAMVYIAYMPRNIKNIVKQLIIFYLISFAFWWLCICTIIFYKTGKYNNEKWSLYRNIPNKNSTTRRDCGICCYIYSI